MKLPGKFLFGYLFDKKSIALVCLLFACSHKPVPIGYGRDMCDHCNMIIMDKRFACEVITSKGKIYKFDANECMLAFLKSRPDIIKNAGSIILVDNYQMPGKLLSASNSYFLLDSTLRSPMGGNLAAFSSIQAASEAAKNKVVKIYTWKALLHTN